MSITFCYHCGKNGHIRSSCRQLKRENKARDEDLRKEVKVASETYLDCSGHIGRDTSPSTSRPTQVVTVPAETSGEQITTPQLVELKVAAKGKGSVVHTREVTHTGPRTFMVRQGTSRGSVVPTCHHCGVKGHIRPYCLQRKREMSQPVKVDPRSQVTSPQFHRALPVHRVPPMHHMPPPPSPSFIPVCHHCGRRGHIKPRCYQLRDQARPRYGGAHIDGLFRELQRMIQSTSAGLQAPQGQTFRGQSTHEMRIPAHRMEWRPRSG